MSRKSKVGRREALVLMIGAGVSFALPSLPLISSPAKLLGPNSGVLWRYVGRTPVVFQSLDDLYDYLDPRMADLDIIFQNMIEEYAATGRVHSWRWDFSGQVFSYQAVFRSHEDLREFFATYQARELEMTASLPLVTDNLEETVNISLVDVSTPLVPFV